MDSEKEIEKLKFQVFSPSKKNNFLNKENEKFPFKKYEEKKKISNKFYNELDKTIMDKEKTLNCFKVKKINK